MYKHIVLLGFIALLASGCLSDLRPAQLAETGLTASSEATGRALVLRAAEAHGGLSKYRSMGTAKAQLTDTWPSLMMRPAMPWPKDGQSMDLVWKIRTDSSRLTFMDGPEKDQQWGIQNWKTYTVEAGGTPNFADDSTIEFWLPTVQYFIEAPFRLPEAPIVAKVGDATIEGVDYDLVFLTWTDVEPQSDVDQYIAWFERDSGRLGFLQYTIRDMMGFLEGCMKYEDYREVDGFWIAHKMTTYDRPGGEPNMHIFEIQSAKIGAGIPENFIIPRPDLKGSK